LLNTKRANSFYIMTRTSCIWWYYDDVHFISLY